MTLKTLPNDITGQGFKTDEGKKFKVLKGDYFSQNSIGKQHQKYLNSLHQVSGFRLIPWPAHAGGHRGPCHPPSGSGSQGEVEGLLCHQSFRPN